MGDKINNMEIFKKLHIDASNQWIFYDERFQNFFDFLSNNITDVNILNETEVLEYEELVHRKEIRSDGKGKNMNKLTKMYPGLMTNTSLEMKTLQQNINIKQKMLKDYDQLIVEMRKTKEELDRNFQKLEDAVKTLEIKESKSFSLCTERAMKLEEIQDDNSKKRMEIDKMFSKLHISPLLMHQMSLDQYFVKCDSFVQYFSLYLKKHFKILDTSDSDNSVSSSQEKIEKLERLKKSIQEYQMRYINELAEARGTQNVIDNLKLSKIHVLSINDVENETHELTIINSYQNIAYNTLMTDLKNCVQQQLQQMFELILLKNTKTKVERARDQYEQLSFLSDIVFKVLSNAELIWIAVQLDLEKHKRFHNSDQQTADPQHCLKHTQRMRNISAAGAPSLANHFLNQLSQLLSQCLQQQIRCDQKSCLYEYEKFRRLLGYSEQGLIHLKHYAHALEQLKEIEGLESTLHAFAYDGPVFTPTVENIIYSKAIFCARIEKQQIEKRFRSLRAQFFENIKERMEKDQLWRYQQMFWIWFLTEPHRILHAMEEVKKAALKMPQIKSLGGIKRKEK